MRWRLARAIGAPPDAADGYGLDIAVARADALDCAALAFAETLAAYRPAALDVGCGHGAMAGRLALCGARAVAIDRAQQAANVARTYATLGGQGQPPRFIQADLREIETLDLPEAPFFVIVCQRMLHYLPYADALTLVRKLNRVLARSGRLYLSASGLRSELGEGYAGAASACEHRWAPLAPAMSEKHHIRAPVCLYTEVDMRTLLKRAGYRVKALYTSDFGNIKAVACL
jgi:SAM-dependent methyltransferase